MTSRATVSLGWSCTNACVFCAQAGLDAEPPGWPSALEAARGQAHEVTLVGGEPSHMHSLDEAVRQASRLGFDAIGLQTNGSDLDRARLASLQRAGLTDLHLSIHAASAAAHDYHVDVPGRHVQCVAVLDVAASLGLTVVVTTVVTRSNARILGDLPRWLLDRGVAAWACRWPTVAGRVGETFDRVVPRLGIAMPYALHALERARRSGLPAAMVGAPLCTLGRYAAHRLPSPSRAYPAACGDCPARPDCSGLDAAYTSRFTDEELHVRPRAAAEPAMPPRLARMFVDIGPEVPATPTTHDAAAHARGRLPVLGRPAPATAETRRKSDARPDVETRDLFPDLYADGEDA